MSRLFANLATTNSRRIQQNQYECLFIKVSCLAWIVRISLYRVRLHRGNARGGLVGNPVGNPVGNSVDNPVILYDTNLFDYIKCFAIQMVTSTDTHHATSLVDTSAESATSVKVPHEHIKIVMVETTHPGNIGAAARAMKNMGLSRLVLVNPKHFPDDEATARASGAVDIVEQIEVVDSLPAAVADCQQVYGASARLRSMHWPQHLPAEMAQDAVGRAQQAQSVAIVFGRESSGLTNAELDCCQQLVHIPTNPDYSSLNVASAIQVLVYEVRMAALQPKPQSFTSEVPLATSEQLQHFYDHLEQVSADIGLLKPDNPRQLMRRFKRLFNRAQMDQHEVAIMRGWLSATQRLMAAEDDQQPS